MAIGGWAEIAADLLLRNDCMCCGRVVAPAQRAGAAGDGATSASSAAGGLAGSALCVDCALELTNAPQRVATRVASVPVYACGPYGGAHRALVLAAKDHMRAPAAKVIGRVWGGAVDYLAAGGSLPHPALRPVAVIPAPTRPSSAKARGGDIVTAAARSLAGCQPGVHVAPVAELADEAPDAVGLNRLQRRASLAEHLRLRRGGVQKLREFTRSGGEALIVDDVCTTGATIAQLALALAARGVPVRAALTVCHA